MIDQLKQFFAEPIPLQYLAIRFLERKDTLRQVCATDGARR